MAAPTFAKVEFEVPITTGTWDLTSPGFGTPDAVLLFMCSGNFNQNRVNSFGQLRGFIKVTDGTQMCAVARWIGGGAANANTSRAYSHVDAIYIPSHSADGLSHKSQYASNVTDGIRMNCVSTTGTLWAGVAVFIKGNIENMVLGRVDNGVEDQVTQVDVGFKPNLVLATTVGQPNPGYLPNGYLSFGAALEKQNGDLVQRSYATFQADGEATSAPCESTKDNAFAEKVTFNSGSLWQARMTEFNATGFEFSQPLDHNGGDDILYFAIQWADRVKMDLPKFNIDSGAGPWNVGTAAGAYGGVTVHNTSANTSWNVNQAGASISTGIWTGATEANPVGMTSGQRSGQSAMYASTWFKSDRITGVSLVTNQFQDWNISGIVDDGDGYDCTVQAGATDSYIGWALTLGDETFGPAPSGGFDGFKIGSVQVDDMKIGTTQVDNIYLGSTKLT